MNLGNPMAGRPNPRIVATLVGSPSIESPALSPSLERSLLGRLRHLAWRVVFGGNRYNRTEFAGAFGDLGTFIPFVVAYITVNKMDPLGILLSFGLFKILSGSTSRRPLPFSR